MGDPTAPGTFTELSNLGSEMNFDEFCVGKRSGTLSSSTNGPSQGRGHPQE